MEHWSVNAAAVQMVEQEVLPNAQRLNIQVHTLANGATVLDMGIHAKGGFRAGKYFAEIGMGGLGKLTYQRVEIGKYQMPGLQVVTENPAVCEMSSYVARVGVPWKGGIQVISGPMRAILRPDDFSQAVDYCDPNPAKTVCGVQTSDMPDEALAEEISKICGLRPDQIYIMAARTGCMVGAVQVCARNVEQSMPTVFDRGFAMSQILQGNAITPVACVVDDEDIAYGRVNDCLIYGQETNLTVSCDDHDIQAMLDDIPFSKNDDVYGTPFQDLFARCGKSWALVPRDWDAPCRINFFNVKTGHSYTTGALCNPVLEQAFIGDGGELA